MIKVKKNLAIILCVIICSLSSVVFATGTSAPTIKITTITSVPGDTVEISIDISNNPGIMAMAFCITYDNNTLEYQNYSKGYLSNYTIKDHSDEGHVSFVNVENTDKNTNGTLLSLLFKVKDDAKPGRHIITLANSNRNKYGNKLHNSFSNSKQQFVVPTVTAGSVVIEETCENSGHKYGEWNVSHEANCTVEGLRSRACQRCQIVQEETIPITHDFESEWTVDKIATPEENGIMSRHCTKCDNVTDKITFSYEEIGGDENDTSGDVSSDEITSSNDALDDPSQESSASDTSNTSSNALDNSSNSSQSAPNIKPTINNTVGEKVSIDVVEKLQDYQQNIKPNLKDEENSSEEIISNEENSTQSEQSNSDTMTGVISEDNTSLQDKEPSFFSTPIGVIMIIVGSLLSIGIIALGIIMIMRNKKAE